MNEELWHKCEAPFWPRRTVEGEWTTIHGQTWRRRINGKWEYSHTGETLEEYAARQLV